MNLQGSWLDLISTRSNINGPFPSFAVCIPASFLFLALASEVCFTCVLYMLGASSFGHCLLHKKVTGRGSMGYSNFQQSNFLRSFFFFWISWLGLKRKEEKKKRRKKEKERKFQEKCVVTWILDFLFSILKWHQNKKIN